MLAARTESKSSGNNARFSDAFYNTFIYMSISLCAAVIATAIALFVHPVSRRVTDRVSFRMMIYALCGSIVYLTVPIMVDPSRDPRACGIIWSFAMLGMHFSSFLFFCIGLNLQLVMIHGVDGEQAEKFYVGGSLSLATLLGTITYFANQYKYNPDIRACWYHDADPVKGFRWQIGLQHSWYFLTMAGELITFTSIVVYMTRLKVFESGPQRQGSSQSTPHSGLSASQQYRKPIGPRQYRNIVLRIALYPLSSLATLGIMSVGSLYIFVEGMRSQKVGKSQMSVFFILRPTFPLRVWNVSSQLLVLNGTYIVSLLRGSIYALVAFTDPVRSCGSLSTDYF
ncbi:hypothetical protein L218DRAFT_1074648 [Marasmius fiardii PR-910]|nr:hypothetical protein L218DRAFT_1074648 [Marasmius fiardii PR-910]